MAPMRITLAGLGMDSVDWLFCLLADDHHARDGGLGRLLRLLGHGGIFAQPGAGRHLSRHPAAVHLQAEAAGRPPG